MIKEIFELLTKYFISFNSFKKFIPFIFLCLMLILLSNCIVKSHKKSLFSKFITGTVFLLFLISVSFYCDNTNDENILELNDLITRIDFSISVFLAVAALRISISQKEMEEFEFCEKIGFHNFAKDISYGIIETTNPDYFSVKKDFKTPSQTSDSIHVLNLCLKEQKLNPQIFYTLKEVKICDSSVSTHTKNIWKILKNKKELRESCGTYTSVGFSYNVSKNKVSKNKVSKNKVSKNKVSKNKVPKNKVSNNKDTQINIYIEDNNDPFLFYLICPEKFYQDNCKNLSLILTFLINDANNSSLKYRELLVIISLFKEKNKYIITETRSFAHK